MSCFECLLYVEIFLGYVDKEKKRKSSCLFGFEESAKTIKEFEKDLDEVLTASDKRSYSGSYYDQEKLLALRDTTILYFTRTFFAQIKALLQILKYRLKIA